VCATRDGGGSNGDGNPIVVALLDSGDDGDDDTPAVYVPKSPYRTKWIKDLIRDTIAEMPSATNQVLRQQLAQYGKPYAITDALLQSARSQLRTTIFGDPAENCKYAFHVKDALEAEGHIVKLSTMSRRDTIQNIKRIVIGDELLRLKEFDGSTILPLERSAFVDWRSTKKFSFSSLAQRTTVSASLMGSSLFPRLHKRLYPFSRTCSWPMHAT